MRTSCAAHSESKLLEGLNSGVLIRKGSFYRRSDCARVNRYYCKACGTHFSDASFSPCFRQHKRQYNFSVFQLLGSTGSIRRTALLLRLNKKTVARKLVFLGYELRERNEWFLDLVFQKTGNISSVQFDEVETFEHTKCKPLSIPTLVTAERYILGFDVAAMPAKGKIASFSRKKYGFRKDERTHAIRSVFERVQHRLSTRVEIFTDKCPRYPSLIREVFPQATHRTMRGRRGRSQGQGELKEGGFDPLYSLNHTAAMFRANVNRLIRKTWCTTKRPDRLRDHLTIYMAFHNLHVFEGSSKKSVVEDVADAQA